MMPKQQFNLDRAVLFLAGSLVTVSVALGYWIHPGFFGFTAFVGLNMMQAALTGFCPAAWAFGKLGVPGGCAFTCGSGQRGASRPARS